MKRFLKLIKYEFKRITRNKLVMSMLLGFSIVVLMVLSLVNVDKKSVPVAVYLDGESIENIEIFDIVEEEINIEKIVYVSSKDEGLSKLRKNDVCLYIEIDSDTTPVSATFYYDSSSSIGRSIKGNLSEKQSEYTYKATNEFLEGFGIKINEAYFKGISFKSSTKTKVQPKQVAFAIEVASVISIILMFGLAYSMSRDNETKISKNLAYMPFGIHEYLWSKIIPYFVLGLIEFVMVYFIGKFAFNINFQANILLLSTVFILFSLSTISLGLLFSCSKSQISTIFLDMIVILIPIFALLMTFIPLLPFVFRIILYLMPISSFVPLISGMIYSGVVIWEYFIILLVLMILYYFVTVYVMKRKIRKGML